MNAEWGNKNIWVYFSDVVKTIKAKKKFKPLSRKKIKCKHMQG